MEEKKVDLLELKPGKCIPTLNHTGFQMATTSPLLEDWIKSYDGENPLLDVGCAYGINTYEALNLDIPVLALDMDRRHLQILEENLSPSKSNLLSCIVGTLPCEIPIPAASISGIMLAEVLHFLKGEEMKQALKTLFDILVPGGRLFITTLAIHYFDDIEKSIVDELYGKIANDNEWPGVVPISSFILSKMAAAAEKYGGTFKYGSTGQPVFMHYTDIHQVTDAVHSAGFEIEKAVEGLHPGYPANSGVNIHANNQIIARKPY